MATRQCIKCSLIKDDCLFVLYKNRKGIRVVSNVCKDCHKLYCKQYTRKDPTYLSRYNQKKKDFRREQKHKAVHYLGSMCIDCTEIVHIAAFDFHHRDPKEKDIDVGLMLQRDWETLQPELDKCVLLCANCHRIRHYMEGTLGRKSTI